MEIGKQFQLSAGPEFSNPLENTVPLSLVLLALAFLVCFGTDSSQSWSSMDPRVCVCIYVCVHNHTNMIFPRKRSCPLKEEPITLDGTRYHRPKVGGRYSLMFFFKGVYQDCLQGGFFFFFLHWYKYQLQWWDGFKDEWMCLKNTLHLVRWIDLI